MNVLTAWFVRWRQLSRREQLSLLLMAGCIAAVLFSWGIKRLSAYQKRLERTQQAHQRVLVEMLDLKSEYEKATGQAALARTRYRNRAPGFSLFAFLDQLSGKARIKDKIVYMKPSSPAPKEGEMPRSRVEMKIKTLTLKQATDFLYQVETSENALRITKAAIQRTGKKQFYVDLTLMVETFMP